MIIWQKTSGAEAWVNSEHESQNVARSKDVTLSGGNGPLDHVVIAPKTPRDVWRS